MNGFRLDPDKAALLIIGNPSDFNLAHAPAASFDLLSPNWLANTQKKIKRLYTKHFLRHMQRKKKD